eukprot:21166-Heterococcus_DN1.PRE.2
MIQSSGSAGLRTLNSLTFLTFVSALGASTAFALRARHRAYMTAPKANKRPYAVKFGKVLGDLKNRGLSPMEPPKERNDDFYWLRDDKREHPAVLEYLEAENRFTQGSTKHTAALREQLYNEFLGHMKETDDTVPYRHGPYLYYTRTEKGKSYRINCRKATPDSPEQILLDENAVAAGAAFCDIGGLGPCPSHKLLAYAVDFFGNELYDLKFKDIATGEPVRLSDVIVRTTGDFYWGADASTLYYTTQKESALHTAYLLIVAMPVTSSMHVHLSTSNQCSSSTCKLAASQCCKHCLPCAAACCCVHLVFHLLG